MGAAYAMAIDGVTDAFVEAPVDELSTVLVVDLPADATLTVTGNQFSGTMGGQTINGRIVAVTTCGYTAVTIMHEGQARAMSLRAKRMGNGLTLTSVPGEPEQIMFTTGGGAMRPRKHQRMSKKPLAPPPPTKTTP